MKINHPKKQMLWPWSDPPRKSVTTLGIAAVMLSGFTVLASHYDLHALAWVDGILASVASIMLLIVVVKWRNA